MSFNEQYVTLEAPQTPKSDSERSSPSNTEIAVNYIKSNWYDNHFCSCISALWIKLRSLLS
jgi:hypothetical protein